MAAGLSGAKLDDVQAAYRRTPSDRCGVVLARLGDPAAQKDFADRLRAAHDRAVADRLADAEYLGMGMTVTRSAWLARALVPILDDKSPARFVMESFGDGVSEEQHLRACDIAVRIIYEMAAEHAWGFAEDIELNYSDAHLEEVRRYVKALP
jgi:hypothetical protein